MESSPKKDLERFLAEDLGKGDITSEILPRRRIKAKIISRETGVIAGTGYAEEIFGMKGCSTNILVSDGEGVEKNQIVMYVSGTTQGVLACERTALNLLSRMSGIATITRQLARVIPEGTRLLATRKTAPGLRRFDKEAVEIGGGERHRMSLDEAVILKDNHIAIAGSIPDLLRSAKQRHDIVEIEVENQDDAILAAESGADIIMLDNFSPSMVTSTIQNLEMLGLREGIMLESSGGITPENIEEFAGTGVDAISVGMITNSVRGIDFSLEI